MITKILEAEDGRRFEAQTDGRTVWVHDHRGWCVGRFSSKGIDVHSDDRDTHCLDCRPGQNPWGLPLRAEWVSFIESMTHHYGVILPSDLLTQFAD